MSAKYLSKTITYLYFLGRSLKHPPLASTQTSQSLAYGEIKITSPMGGGVMSRFRSVFMTEKLFGIRTTYQIVLVGSTGLPDKY